MTNVVAMDENLFTLGEAINITTTGLDSNN